MKNSAHACRKRGPSSRRVLAAIASGLMLALVSASVPPAVAQTRDRGNEDFDAASVPLLRSESPQRQQSPLTRPGVSRTASQGAPAPDPNASVEELVDRRDAHTRVFRNENGSLMVDAYTTPIHYETDDGWVPIDNSLSEDRARTGRLRTNGNDWSASFGSSHEGVELHTADAFVSMSPALVPSEDESGSEPPEVVRAPEPKPEPRTAGEVQTRDAIPERSVVEYSQVWPGVDLRYEVRGSGLKEDIVVSSSESSFEFAFDVKGATFEPHESGGLRISGVVGETFWVPPPVVNASDGSDLTSDSGVRYEIREPAEDADARLVVVLDEMWLRAQPPESFPLVVDPSFSLLTPNEALTIASDESSMGAIAIGAAGGTLARGAVRFSQYEPYINQGYRAYTAILFFFRDGWSETDPATSIEVFDQGAKPTSFGEIGTDRPFIGAVTDPQTTQLNQFVTAPRGGG